VLAPAAYDASAPQYWVLWISTSELADLPPGAPSLDGAPPWRWALTCSACLGAALSASALIACGGPNWIAPVWPGLAGGTPRGPIFLVARVFPSSSGQSPLPTLTAIIRLCGSGAYAWLCCSGCWCAFPRKAGCCENSDDGIWVGQLEAISAGLPDRQFLEGSGTPAHLPAIHRTQSADPSGKNPSSC